VATTVWIVDAFTSIPLTGNPAGVVPDARGLSESQMQAIAAEIHASETAFVLPPSQTGQADYRIRYFTPQQEVDLCGHATIGSICGMVAAGLLSLEHGTGVCKIETKVGVLSIRYGQDGHRVFAEMAQATPSFRALDEEAKFVAQVLGIDVADLDLSLPMEYSYTGLWDFFVPVRSLEVMRRLRPDFAAMAQWNTQNNVVSTHVYTRQCVDAQHHFHSRDFAPAVGIPEDPATGTATGALAALLYRHGHIQSGRDYAFEQGYEIGRESVLSSRIEVCGNAVQVFVGGSGVVTLEGVLNL